MLGSLGVACRPPSLHTGTSLVHGPRPAKETTGARCGQSSAGDASCRGLRLHTGNPLSRGPKVSRESAWAGPGDTASALQGKGTKFGPSSPPSPPSNHSQLVSVNCTRLLRTGCDSQHGRCTFQHTKGQTCLLHTRHASPFS